MIATAPHRIVTTSRTLSGRETHYERLAAALWAIAISLVLLCSLLICIWLLFGEAHLSRQPIDGFDGHHGSTSQMSQPEPIPAEAMAVQVPDDFPDPADTNSEKSLLEIAEQIAMTATSAIESVNAANLAPGDSGGETSESLGRGEPIGSKRTSTRSRRWIIEVTSPRDVADYVAMLRDFTIEPAIAFSDGRLVYLNLSGDTPAVRHSTNFDQENRFYARWDQGDLKQLDEELFASAGVDRSDGIIIHFFSAATEHSLQQKSLAFAGRSAEDIGRTWFRLSYRNSGSEIEVLRQVGK